MNRKDIWEQFHARLITTAIGRTALKIIGYGKEPGYLKNNQFDSV